jgi:hypothetical protein
MAEDNGNCRCHAASPVQLTRYGRDEESEPVLPSRYGTPA